MSAQVAGGGGGGARKPHSSGGGGGGGGDLSAEVTEETFEVEEEVEVDEDGNEVPATKPAARGGARGDATAASKAQTAVAAESAQAEGRRDAAKRAVAAARHEALKRLSADKARGVAARFAATAMLSPNELLSFTLVAKLREGHQGPVTCAVWADDARHIASCAQDGSVAVWDTHSCMVRRQYVGHTGPVRMVRGGRPAPRARADARSPLTRPHAPKFRAPPRPRPPPAGRLLPGGRQ
jgi:hypothetical protein